MGTKEVRRPTGGGRTVGEEGCEQAVHPAPGDPQLSQQTLTSPYTKQSPGREGGSILPFSQGEME